MKPELMNPENARAGARNPEVEVRDMRHSYGAREALRGVSFQVGRGEIFALLGPNGSGKTTLFRILSTLFPPSSGEAVIAGHTLSADLSGVRRKIGVVFQNPGLDARLTVYENLAHQAYLYGYSGAALRERCGRMLKALVLTDRARDLAGTLSGGLKRRVELAKGLLHEPEVVLLDEPSTGLDPGARRDLWQYLARLRADSGVTVLVTTHLMEEAELCDRIAIMNEGLLIRTGTPQELKREIGGDVLAVRASDPARLASEIRNRFKLEPREMDGELLIEHREAARFVTELVEAFPGAIESVTFRKPTLEDVFVHHTGHRFWTETEEEKPRAKH